MPIQPCTLPDGSQGWQWGRRGFCHADLSDAEAQARAAYANGYREGGETWASDAQALAYNILSDAQPLAFDGSSVRSFDEDGHLHVSDAAISKANVCPYWGSEIPDSDSLGLDPKRQYHLLRDPEELRKGAASFAGKPVMLVHRGQTATDHARALVVGSVGSTPSFDGQYLRAPLHIWDGEAIAGINDNSQRELSCGYRYTADMTPGDYNGERYDGVMRYIRGNHVALVREGRAGPEVFVGDAALSPSPSIVTSTRSSRMPSLFGQQASMALRMYIADKLAADQRFDLAPIMRNVSARTWPEDKKRIIADLKKATKGKLAADASIEDLPGKLSTLDAPAQEMRGQEIPPKPPNPGRDSVEEKKAEIEQMLSGKLSAEEIAAIVAILDDQDLEEPPPADPDPEPAPNPDPADDRRGRMRDAAPLALPGRGRDAVSEGVTTNGASGPMPIDRRAMDAAISKAVREAEVRTVQRMQDLADARAAVMPIVGTMAADAAQEPADVYKYALDQMNVETDGVPPAAYRALFNAASRERAKAAEMTPPPTSTGVPGAFDSAALKSITDRFPGIHTRQA
jgi:hypothetical protein